VKQIFNAGTPQRREYLAGGNMAIKQVGLLAVLLISLPLPGAAQTSKEVNEANNPLTPKLTVNLQDQYISSYYNLDGDSNAILV
jgi:hypothetical protein